MENKIIDLHTHSTYSDGSMTPIELVKHAKASGLSAIALSDHDNSEGVNQAVTCGKEVGIEVIPAIELSAQSETETHILGYFIDPDCSYMKTALEKVRHVREQRIVETCELLQKKCNINVTMDEVKEVAQGGIFCRAHIATIMTQKGYSESPKDAFNKWLNVGRPAYSGTQAFNDAQAIELIRNSGGDAYLAHLHLTKKSDEELDAFVKKLTDEGLTGIEGYYTDYTPEMEIKYRALAKKYGLKLSGGTDFHGTFKPHISIGRGLGNLTIPYSVLENMKKRN